MRFRDDRIARNQPINYTSKRLNLYNAPNPVLGTEDIKLCQIYFLSLRSPSLRYVKMILTMWSTKKNQTWIWITTFLRCEQYKSPPPSGDQFLWNHQSQQEPWGASCTLSLRKEWDSALFPSLLSAGRVKGGSWRAPEQLTGDTRHCCLCSRFPSVWTLVKHTCF